MVETHMKRKKYSNLLPCYFDIKLILVRVRVKVKVRVRVSSRVASILRLSNGSQGNVRLSDVLYANLLVPGRFVH